MNVANLQLEGLLMAIASINHVLVRKGLLPGCGQFPDQATATGQSVSAGGRRTAFFRTRPHGRSNQGVEETEGRGV